MSNISAVDVKKASTDIDTNNTLSDEWKICCSGTNRNFVRYCVQVCFGASVVIFSMAQIMSAEQTEQTEIYFSLISGTVSYFLPNPTIK